MKIIFRKKNNHLSLKLTLLSLLVFGSAFSQTDSCAFFGSKPIFPYYHPSSPNNGKDFYTIKKEFRKIISAQTDFNGIITVNFFINYKGETNYYTTQICDLNYKPLANTNDIKLLSDQTLLAVKQTSPWKPSLDEKRNPINSRKFYSFRFNNGTLIEILPK